MARKGVGILGISMAPNPGFRVDTFCFNAVHKDSTKLILVSIADSGVQLTNS